MGYESDIFLTSGKVSFYRDIKTSCNAALRYFSNQMKPIFVLSALAMTIAFHHLCKNACKQNKTKQNKTKNNIQK